MANDSEDFRQHCVNAALPALLRAMMKDQSDPELGPMVKRIRADMTGAWDSGLMGSYLNKSPSAFAMLKDVPNDADALWLVWYFRGKPYDAVPFRALWVAGTEPGRTTGKIAAVFVPDRDKAKNLAADLQRALRARLN